MDAKVPCYTSKQAIEQPVPAETGLNCWRLAQGRDYTRALSRFVRRCLREYHARGVQRHDRTQYKSSQDFEPTPHSSSKREKSADVGGDRSRDTGVGKAETTQFTSSTGSENQTP